MKDDKKPELDAVQTIIICAILALVLVPFLGVWWRLVMWVWEWALR